MKIFDTERLIVRKLTESDADDYYDMMGNPNVMNLLPSKVMSRKESDEHLLKHKDLEQNLSTTNVWGIETKSGNEFIGICAFLKNDENEDEIGYRFREKFWHHGYGTEIAKGLISYGFDKLQLEKITADVDIKNPYSVKILDKFMSSSKEFFNESDNCVDRRYEILKTNW